MNLMHCCGVIFLLVCFNQINGQIEDAYGDSPNEKSPTQDVIDTTNSDTTTYTLDNGDRYEGEYENDAMHGHGTYYFASGATYVGNWIHNKRSGQGVMNWTDGSKYDGNWVDDERTGRGHMVWSNDETYDGEFVNGKRQGFGTHQYSDGTKYEGAWINDTRYGQGILTYSDGTKHEGGFKNNIMHGRGVEIFTNNTQYAGFWIDGHRQAPGVFTFKNGEKYEGDWINDEQSGQGIYIWQNNEKYDGDWLEGKRHGTGSMSYADGANYAGKWIDDTRTGNGILTTVDNETYDGDWLDDKRHGKGVYTWSNGETYDGDWIDDKRHGKGVYTWSNGEKYNGDWIEDKMTGTGIRTKLDGEYYDGEWVNGQRHGYGIYDGTDGTDGTIYNGDWLHNEMSGRGYIIWPNKHQYEGEFQNGKMHGEGTYIFPDGRRCNGSWINGRGSDKCERMRNPPPPSRNILPNEKPQSPGFKSKSKGENENKPRSRTTNFLDGRIYTGDWLGDKISGKGIMTWPNQNVYEGDWIDNKRHGTGTMRYADGTNYTGDWINDKRSGRGVLIWFDGRRCDGVWTDDEPSCTVTYPGVKSSYSSILNRYSANTNNPSISIGNQNYLYFIAIEVIPSLDGIYTFVVRNNKNIHGTLYNHARQVIQLQPNVVSADDNIYMETDFQLKAKLIGGQILNLIMITNQTSPTGKMIVDVYGPASVTLKVACLLPCLNGGKCMASNTCSCTSSWTGSRCETPIIRTVESIYSNSLFTDGSSFVRPNREENEFLFVAIEITASTSGAYTLTAESDFDTYGYLYKAPFNPQSPWVNLIEENDDNLPNSNFEFNTTLTMNQPIVLVVTTFRASQTGSFKIVVRGPKQVTFEEKTFLDTCQNGMKRDGDTMLVVTDTRGQNHRIASRYGWSIHNRACEGHKTGLVLYPTSINFKNVVLLLCDSAFGYKFNGESRHQQLIRWYYTMYASSKQYQLVTGFDVKWDGSIQFNTWKQSGHSFFTDDFNQMNVCEQDVIRKVIDDQLNSYVVESTNY